MNKSFAALIAVFFVVTAVMSLIFFNFDRNAFNAETYQRAFAREDFYNKLPATMAQSIASPGTDKEGLPLVMQGLSAEAWEGFIRALLPPDTLEIMGDDVLTSTFSYLNLQADSVQANLVPLKSAMTNESGTQAVLVLIKTLPACTVEQIAQTTFDLFTGGQIQLCNPPDEFLPFLTPIIQGQMQLAASLIPDVLTLVEAPPQNDPRQQLQTSRFLMRLSPFLPIVFLLGLTVFFVRSLEDWLYWWGIPLFITGFAAFMIGILGAPVIGTILEKILANRLPNYLPPFLAEFTGDLASAMARALLSPVIWQGLVLSTMGTVMTGIAMYLNRSGK